jgi:hypothetical protein
VLVAEGIPLYPSILEGEPIAATGKHSQTDGRGDRGKKALFQRE